MYMQMNVKKKEKKNIKRDKKAKDTTLKNKNSVC